MKTLSPILLALLAIFAVFYALHLDRDAQAQPNTWTEVTESRSCQFAACPAGDGFTVERSGEYRTGRGAQGTLSAEELAQLGPLTDALAAQNLVPDPLCDATAGEPGVTVSVRTGDPFNVYEGRSDRSLCHRGSVESVLAFKENMDQLAAKYDRFQAGTIPVFPSPSPTPSMSPSPSPSPTECMGQPDGSACMGKCAPPSCDTGCTQGAWCQSGSCVPFAITCPGPTATP